MENQCVLTGSADSSSHTSWEDIHSKRLVDSASRHVTEGRFEQARLQLETAQRLCAGTKGLAELLAIAEVCLAAAGRSCPCKSRGHGFYDWYHILQIDEKADINLIKRRYRQLALLLHPDKNTHVKAEGAFKYISQAYDCLSDKKKRLRFNLDRAKLFCGTCSVSSGTGDAFPTVADTVSRRHPDYQEVSVSSGGYCSGVCGPSEILWNSARFQTFRRKARARADAAGLEFGSRIWRWNEQFDKLNIRRDDADYGRPHILSTTRRHVNEVQGGYMWGNRVSPGNQYTHCGVSELQYYDNRRDMDMRMMSGNGNVRQPEKSLLSRRLDHSRKSVKPEAGGGQVLNSKVRESAYPSYGTGYSGYRKNLPTTAEIIQFFKNLPSNSTEPERAENHMEAKSTTTLKEIYFPSKKDVDCSSAQESPEQHSSVPQPVVPSTHRVQTLPEKDLSRLDSSSLLKNLDAALSDITHSAGKSHYSASIVSQLKKDRMCPQIDSCTEISSIPSKVTPSGKPPRTPVSEGRKAKSGTIDGTTCLENDKYTHSLSAAHSGGFPVSSSPTNSVEENPSILITPLLRKQGEGNKIQNTRSSTFDSHPVNRDVPHSICQSLVTGGIHPSEPALEDSYVSSLGSKTSNTSGLNPLLSSEKLGKWIDGLASSLNVTNRTHEDEKLRYQETSSSGREEICPTANKFKTWWENKDQIPSYLSAKRVGALLPDYGRIWAQGDDYSNLSAIATSTSDPPKEATIATSSITKSDFSCNPAKSLASSARVPTSDFSCSPAISLASSGRITSSNLSFSPAISFSSPTKNHSSQVSCCPARAVPQPSSTRLLGSEDPPQLSGLRFLQTGRFERIAGNPTTKILEHSAASGISGSSNILHLHTAYSKLNAEREFVPSSRDNATTSNRYQWLWPQGGLKVQVGADSWNSKLEQQLENSIDPHNQNQIEQNLDNKHKKPDELVANLERLREEAKSIASTLQNFNDRSRIEKATTALPGICSSNTHGIRPESQLIPRGLTT